MRALLVALSLALAACDGAAPSDAGVPASDAATPFDEPAPPAPPVFAPCPAGWSAAPSGEGFDACEPPSAAECPAGSVRFVDETACAPIGAACPAGEWASPPSGATAIYVRPGASGGDGSMSAPYGTIRDAILRAPPGAAVMLARGTYPEAIDVFGGLTIVGACAAQTFLAPATGRAAVRAAELGITVTDVTLRPGGEAHGVDVTGGLTLRSVVIEGAADDGILVVDGGELDAARLVIRDSRALAPEFGRGVTVAGGRAEIVQGIFERCPGSGILGSTGSEVRARAVIVRGSGEGIRGRPQIIAQGMGARFELSESVLEDGAGTGVVVNEDGVLQIDQVVVRRMRADPAVGGSSAGLFARSRGRIEGRRLRIEDVAFLGMAFVEDAVVSLEDVLVARITTALLDGEPLAIGLLYSGPELGVRRLAMRDVERMAVSIELGTSTFEDVSIARIGAGTGGEHHPMGFSQREGDATLRRVRVEGARGVGLYSLTSALALEDVAVIDAPGLEDGRFGRGIEVVQGGATFARVLVEAAREVGVHAFDGAVVQADGLRVARTRGRDCQDTTCPDTPGGIGIAAIGAALRARDFTVDGARLCGAMIAGGPSAALDLSAGAIRGASVGACVQVEGYDLERLTDGVEYRDNGIPLDATDHATPAPTDPLGMLEL